MNIGKSGASFWEEFILELLLDLAVCASHLASPSVSSLTHEKEERKVGVPVSWTTSNLKQGIVGEMLREVSPKIWVGAV